MKHLNDGGAKQASALGKMLARGSAEGVTRNVLAGGKGGVLAKAQGGFGFSFLLQKKQVSFARSGIASFRHSIIWRTP
jgi:hypothetical protein